MIAVTWKTYLLSEERLQIFQIFQIFLAKRRAAWYPVGHETGRPGRVYLLIPLIFLTAACASPYDKLKRVDPA